jgi:hypothetical protein
MVLNFNPLSSNRFTQINDIIWPDGGIEPPSDVRPNEFDCPWPDGDETTSLSGVQLLYGTLFGIAAVTTIIVGLVYRKWFAGSVVAPLDEKSRPTQADLIAYFTLVVSYV